MTYNIYINRYKGKVDNFDVENIKLHQYLKEPDCLLTEKDLQFYIVLWNKVRWWCLQIRFTY